MAQDANVEECTGGAACLKKLTVLKGTDSAQVVALNPSMASRVVSAVVVPYRTGTTDMTVGPLKQDPETLRWSFRDRLLLPRKATRPGKAIGTPFRRGGFKPPQLPPFL